MHSSTDKHRFFRRESFVRRVNSSFRTMSGHRDLNKTVFLSLSELQIQFLSSSLSLLPSVRKAEANEGNEGRHYSIATLEVARNAPLVTVRSSVILSVKTFVGCANSLRACLKNGWCGRPARTGRRPADRNDGGQRDESHAGTGVGRSSHSVRRVAGRHRLVACATQDRIFRQALNLTRNRNRNHSLGCGPPRCVHLWFQPHFSVSN